MAPNLRETYIEETGLLMEHLGATRMAGRILGYIFVTDKEMVSFDELVEVLKASKSSISTNVRNLIHLGYVKAVSLPGDRKTYYSLEHEICWSESLQKRMRLLDLMQKSFQGAVDLRVRKTDKTSQWLRKGSDFYAFVAMEIPAMFQKWEQMNKD
jgi:DNA-binding transcriptional regulator GbsR (MarR family)